MTDARLFWKTLLDRAPGGRDVARDPADYGENSPEPPVIWPTCPPPGASQAGINLFLGRILSPDSPQTFLFLIGSAGNGKSHLASLITSRTGFSHSIGRSRAERTYLLTQKNASGLPKGAREVIIVNDATIPKEDGDTSPLFDDIQRAIDSGSHLLVCVNRGVVLKDLRLVRRQDRASNSEVLGLLEGMIGEPPLPRVSRSNSNSRPSLFSSTQGFYKYAALDGGIEAHLIAMDGISLLEPPVTLKEEDKGCELKFDAYRINSFSSEMARNDRVQSPAFDLFTRTVAALPEPESRGALHANRCALSNYEFLTGLCQCLRGAELLDGARLTYRDLWGIASIMLLGSSIQQKSYRETPLERDGELAEEVETSQSILNQLSILANNRLHLSIFGGDPIPGSYGTPVFSQREASFFKAISRIDPAKVPASSNTVLRAIEDAIMATNFLDALPSDQLKKKFPDHPGALTWSSLDRQIERYVIQAIQESEATKEFRALSAWLYRYLARHFGLATGIFPDSDICEQMTQAWMMSTTQGHLPPDLVAGISYLLFQEGRLCFPLMGRLATPVKSGNRQANLIGRMRPNIECKSHVEGDHVIVSIMIGDSESATVHLDSGLIRQCIRNTPESGYYGSYSQNSLPVIERARASLINTSLQNLGTGKLQIAASASPEDERSFVPLDPLLPLAKLRGNTE